MQDIVTVASGYAQSCAISRRAHYLASERSIRWHRFLGIVAAVATGGVGTSILGSLQVELIDQPTLKIVAGLVSIIAAFLAAAQTSLKHAERAENHRVSGARYSDLRRRFDVFILNNAPPALAGSTDEPAPVRNNALAELKELIAKLAEIGTESPQLPDRIYAKAEREEKRIRLTDLAAQRARALAESVIANFGKIAATAAIVLVLAVGAPQIVAQTTDWVSRSVRGDRIGETRSAPPDTSVGGSWAAGATSDDDGSISSTVREEPGAIAAGRRFAEARLRPPLLRAMLQRLPKGGDLHTHLSGAVYAESLIRWAAEEKLCLDEAAMRFTAPPCDGRKAVAEIVNDNVAYRSMVDAFSLRHFVPGAQSGHDQFFDAFAKFGEVTWRRPGDMLAEVVSRAAAQNVGYVEVMQTLQGSELGPLAASVKDSAGPMLGADPSMPLAREDLERLSAMLFEQRLPEIVERARQALAAMIARKNSLLGCKGDRPDAGCSVTVRFLQQVNRNDDPVRVFTGLLFAFELVKAEPLVVGVNMVGPEDYRIALADYRRHMAMLDFLAGQAPAVKVALHAGELSLGLVPPEHLRNHIRLAAELGHARRIGHAVSLAYEDNPTQLLRDLAKRRVAIEINLSSNARILQVAGRNHPFTDYRAFGVPVTLSTDDEGIARSDLTNEYQIAVETYDLQYQDVKALARNSLEFSFLPGQSLWTSERPLRPVPECADDQLGETKPSEPCRGFLVMNQRAHEQWRLEARFGEFEKLSMLEY